MFATFIRPDPLLRCTLVVAAGLAAGLAAPTPIRAVLTLAAATAVGDQYIRSHTVPGRTAVAATIGGGFVLLILTGVALNLTPSGLGVVGWACGVTLGALVLVLARAKRPLRPLPTVRYLVRSHGLWYLGAAVLVAAGLAVSIVVTQQSERPPVQLSADVGPQGDVVITIAAAAPSGPYDLWLEDGKRERLLRTAIPVDVDSPLSLALPHLGNRQMRVALRATGSSGDLLYVIVNPGG
jgi:hypothetical protein